MNVRYFRQIARDCRKYRTVPSKMAGGAGGRKRSKKKEVSRGERIRPSDILVPNQARYQTALRPEDRLRVYVIPDWLASALTSVRRAWPRWGAGVFFSAE